MPVLRGDMSRRPAWCELEHFAVVRLSTQDSQVWPACHLANKLVVVDGTCTVDGKRVAEGGSLDVPTGDWVLAGDGPAIVVVLGGRWGEDIGGAGVFGVSRAEPDEKPYFAGDPAGYPKHTLFDRHYHDCDEYWIIVSGAGTASSEDVLYEIGPGDCVATRMGHHHDFPLVEAPVRAVFFETTMRGQRRRGHLWEHTHGPARPAKDEELNAWRIA